MTDAASCFEKGATPIMSFRLAGAALVPLLVTARSIESEEDDAGRGEEASINAAALNTGEKGAFFAAADVAVVGVEDAELPLALLLPLLPPPPGLAPMKSVIDNRGTCCTLSSSAK